MMGADALIATADNSFVMFGTAHLVVLALTVIVPVGLAAACGRGRRKRTTRTICWALAAMLLINEIIVYVYSLISYGPDHFLSEKLPLHLCGAGLYLTAYVLIRPKQLLYEFAFFLGLAGTLQAIITPNFPEDPTLFHFMQFFITHCGIVAAVLFATWGMRMRPRLRGVMYTWLAGNVLVAVAGIADWLGGWNYMFLCAKPEGPAGDSPFFFVPWPWYILALEPVALLMFYALYAPFPLCDKLRAWRCRSRQAPRQ